MTSHMWLNATYVNKPIWTHDVWIIVQNPSTDVIHKNYATVLIQAGNSTTPSPMGTYIATNTKTIVGIIYNVPNQPLIFLNDPQHQKMSAGEILAYSEKVFDDFYNINSSYRYNCIVKFAMAKSA
eukprot:355583_1